MKHTRSMRVNIKKLGVGVVCSGVHVGGYREAFVPSPVKVGKTLMLDSGKFFTLNHFLRYPTTQKSCHNWFSGDFGLGGPPSQGWPLWPIQNWNWLLLAIATRRTPKISQRRGLLRWATGSEIEEIHADPNGYAAPTFVLYDCYIFSCRFESGCIGKCW